MRTHIWKNGKSYFLFSTEKARDFECKWLEICSRHLMTTLHSNTRFKGEGWEQSVQDYICYRTIISKDVKRNNYCLLTVNNIISPSVLFLNLLRNTFLFNKTYFLSCGLPMKQINSYFTGTKTCDDRMIENLIDEIIDYLKALP